MTDTEKPCCLNSFDHAKAECPQCRDLSCNHLGDVERNKQSVPCSICETAAFELQLCREHYDDYSIFVMDNYIMSTREGMPLFIKAMTTREERS